jgi:hypothetical protein
MTGSALNDLRNGFRSMSTHPGPVPTLLLFADISGYTRYIRENSYTAAHAVATTAALLDSVIDRLEPALQLVKLEGDAAFCHADPALLQADLPELLLATFAAFDACKARLSACNTCDCLACKALGNLELKMILHHGDVVHYPTRRGLDLAGLPVILLHRLSKNSVDHSRYILWTAPVAAHLSALAPAQMHSEDCEGVGAVDVQVYLNIPNRSEPVVAGATERFIDHLNKTRQWILPTLQRKPGKAAAFGATLPS